MYLRCSCFIIVIFLFTAPSIEAVRSQLAFGISCNEPVLYVLRPVRLKFIKRCRVGCF